MRGMAVEAKSWAFQLLICLVVSFKMRFRTCRRASTLAGLSWEGDGKGRNTRHRAVVNVGYSPTFEGKENAEKIIEAHLMFQDDDGGDDDGAGVLDPPDFYNETMRLELVAFLRPEIKFPSFPALIAQITADVQDSKHALSQDEPFATQWPVNNENSDSFYSMTTDENPWIGSSGGDGAASWEFVDMRACL